jgi:hypothetical protein
LASLVPDLHEPVFDLLDFVLEVDFSCEKFDNAVLVKFVRKFFSAYGGERKYYFDVASQKVHLEFLVVLFQLGLLLFLF